MHNLDYKKNSADHLANGKLSGKIFQIAEKEFRQEWKVNVADGSVIFGSAKDNWAMSAAFMQKKGVSFKDIIDAYSKDK